jgi:hypothetical protein
VSRRPLAFPQTTISFIQLNRKRNSLYTFVLERNLFMPGAVSLIVYGWVPLIVLLLMQREVSPILSGIANGFAAANRD